MDVRLLGPVELCVGAAAVDCGGPRQRTVLAALAVDCGRPVLTETLVDRVWGTDPPARPRETLYVYIARLRALLDRPDGTGARLVRRARGYLLDLDPDRVDLLRFQRLAGLARDRQCPDDRRVALLGEALDLWRGAPLADLAGEWPERVRQAERRLHRDVTLDWATAQLRRDDAGETVAPLTALLAEHPLDETVTGALMRALHHSGRTTEALDRFTALRDHLAGQLGIDPGPELRQLHRSILRGQSVVPGARSGTAGAAPVTGATSAPLAEPPAGRERRVVVPAQLPRTVPGFAGRESELAELDAILAAGEAGPAVAVLAGTAGVGKTALAVHWAHRVADRFPDGQLYANLRGFDPDEPAVRPHAVLREFLAALDTPYERIPEGLDAQAALYRSLLAGKRVLVVLDNARDADQVRPLLPGGSGCLVLATSRNLLTSLVAAEGARVLALDVLTATEARRMLANRLGRHRVVAEPRAADDIVTSCGGLPVALAIVAGRAATNPHFPLATLSDELRRARTSLDVLDGGDGTSNVRAIFSWSYRALSPAAAGLFRRTGLHPLPEVDETVAATLAGRPVEAVRPLLAELVGASMVGRPAPDHYVCHDLLHAYALELAEADDPEPDRRQVLRRTLDHHLYAAHEATGRLYPARPQPPLVPVAPGVTRVRLDDATVARAWFETAQPVLRALIRQAWAHGLDRYVWQLAWRLILLSGRPALHDQGVVLELALAAADRSDDRLGRCYLLRTLAGLRIEQQRFAEAEPCLDEALQLAVELADLAGAGDCHVGFTILMLRGNRVGAALHHAEQAYALFRQGAGRASQASALQSVGACHGLLGNYEFAVACCGMALKTMRELGDRRGEAHALDSLGSLHLGNDDPAPAVDCHRRALELFAEVGHALDQAETLVRLGEAHLGNGDPEAARSAWLRAVRLLDEARHPQAGPVRARLELLSAPTG